MSRTLRVFVFIAYSTLRTFLKTVGQESFLYKRIFLNDWKQNLLKEFELEKILLNYIVIDICPYSLGRQRVKLLSSWSSELTRQVLSETIQRFVGNEEKK